MASVVQEKEKTAFFLDKLGHLERVKILINPNQYIYIYTFLGNRETGYMHLYFHPRKQIYLSNIYCFDAYRGLGIASHMSELLDYLLQDYIDFVIQGTFEPYQASNDTNIPFKSQKELNKRAAKFYQKAGYQLLAFSDYQKNVNFASDFLLLNEEEKYLVVKQIKPQEHFFYQEIAGCLFHENYLEIKEKVKSLKK